MGWPWQFLDLSTAEKLERRLALDRYGEYAQLSTVLPVAAFLVFRLVRWAVRRVVLQRLSYDTVPNSPIAKRRRQSVFGSWEKTARRAAWWLEDDVEFAGQNWGRRDQLVFGAAWTAWLLFLCMIGTGNDYFHLTKRFGIIGASQFPIQYLLSLKYINPVAYAFRSSHEQINRWHRVLGRISYLLISLHGIMYLNYYVQAGILGQKVFARVPAIGIFALIGMTLLTTTAFSVIRHYSYRVFFVTHLLVALALPPAIFFHVSHARVYMIESLVVFLADLAARRIDTVTSETTVESIPGTSLIKIIAKVPQAKATRFYEHPGSHVYLNIPTASRPDQNLLSIAHQRFELIFNPFTVASVDEASGELTLVVRQMRGPMTETLARHASAGSMETKVPLGIQGPYGVSSHLSRLAGAEFDRILLFAGGVGATYIMPIYQYILSENPAVRVEMIWAIREAREATWPVSGSEKTMNDDGNIRIFLTGNTLDSSNGNTTSADASGGVEMNRMHKDRQRNKYVSERNLKRPDLRKMVDNAFRQGQEERVAVLVCGPEAMASELRKRVGVWVKKGRYVWWHNECFSW